MSVNIPIQETALPKTNYIQWSPENVNQLFGWAPQFRAASHPHVLQFMSLYPHAPHPHVQEIRDHRFARRGSEVNLHCANCSAEPPPSTEDRPLKVWMCTEPQCVYLLCIPCQATHSGSQEQYLETVLTTLLDLQIPKDLCNMISSYTIVYIDQPPPTPKWGYPPDKPYWTHSADCAPRCLHPGPNNRYRNIAFIVLGFLLCSHSILAICVGFSYYQKDSERTSQFTTYEHLLLLWLRIYGPISLFQGLFFTFREYNIYQFFRHRNQDMLRLMVYVRRVKPKYLSQLYNAVVLFLGVLILVGILWVFTKNQKSLAESFSPLQLYPIIVGIVVLSYIILIMFRLICSQWLSYVKWYRAIHVASRCLVWGIIPPARRSPRYRRPTPIPTPVR